MDFDDPQKLVALLFGAVLTVVGLLGFGIASNGLLLGIFGVNALHNVVHLGSGLAGVAAALAMGGAYARDYNRVLGVVYALVAALGLAAPGLVNQLLGVQNTMLAPDNLLHVALAVVFLGVGFGVKQGVESELF